MEDKTLEQIIDEAVANGEVVKATTGKTLKLPKKKMIEYESLPMKNFAEICCDGCKCNIEIEESE